MRSASQRNADEADLGATLEPLHQHGYSSRGVSHLYSVFPERSGKQMRSASQRNADEADFVATPEPSHQHGYSSRGAIHSTPFFRVVLG
eukprot:6382040-Pyramimonas_sp.AAC.1